MVTSKLIGLHNKCTAILAMIERVNLRIEAERSILYLYDSVSSPFHIIKLTNNRCDIIKALDYEKKIKDRITAYYATVHMQLSEDVFKKLAHYFDYSPAA